MQVEKVPGHIQRTLYLVSFSKVLDIKATLHDGPRDIPAQNERELAAWLCDIQRISLHRECCSTKTP